MKKTLLAASMAIIVLASCKKDDNDNENDMNSTDETFVTQVAIGNKAEVMAGQLAATKGTSAGVKAFGQMMVTEHTQAQTDLQAVYSGLGRTMPDSVDLEHQALMTRLNSLTGFAFDTAYMNSQVKDHQKTLTIFQSEVSSGNNMNVQTYASTYLPHIQMHLQTADSLSKTLKP
jgi:putative membrane protein